MDSPERINEILPILQSAWERVPDWRLGQLMVNLLGEVRDEYKFSKNDPFYLEDDVLLLALQRFLEKTENGS